MDLTQRTLDLIKHQQQNPLRKVGITTATGLVYYSLQPVAVQIVPVITPFRNSIPRVGVVSGGGTAEHWKAITSVNSLGINAAVSEGNRGGVLTTTVTDFLGTYKGIGLEHSVTFEATYGSQGFDDARAVAVKQLLQAVMIEEEKTIVSGNSGLALATCGTPVVTPVTSGGTLANGNLYVYSVALTQQGYIRSLASGVAGGVVTSVTRTNADASTDTFGGGCSQISSVGSSAIGGAGTYSATVKVPAKSGAYGYAWYWSQTSGAANCTLGAITSTNVLTITAPTGAGTQNASLAALGSDNSVNALEFDGLLTQVVKGSGYLASLDGATLTADTFGGVVEIDIALKYFWDNYRLSPTGMWGGAQVLKDITRKVLSGTTSPVTHINITSGTAQGNLTGSNLVRSYLNKFAMDGAVELPLRLHPNIPDNTLFFDLAELPYFVTDAPAARRIRTRQEYYQTEWPLTTRKYPYGVYADELLQVYVPFGMGLITNIGIG
jgi:hypothetical protein